MKKHRKILIFLLVLSFTLTFFSGCGRKDDSTVITVDFSQKVGREIQLLKKINAHCPVWPLNGNMQNTMNAGALHTVNRLAGLNAEYFRTDMFFGNHGLGSTIASSAALKGTTDLEYSNVKLLADSLKKVEVSPYLILNGIPEYAQEGGFNRKPDYVKYAEVMENMSAYLSRHGIAAAYETWNEPDLADWYDSVYDLMKTSAVATAAIKRGDENAVVSALGLAFITNFFKKSETHDGVSMPNFERFLVEAKKEAFPDAIAWHYYGSEDGLVENNYDEQLDLTYYLNIMYENINKYAEEYPELATLQQTLTEYHPVSTAASQEDTTSNISAMFESIDPLLRATDVSSAFWPMYLSTDFGVVDKNTYRNTPAHSVLWCYGRLPVDRTAVDGVPDEVGAYAAADSGRAGVIVYNNGDKTTSVDIRLNNVPFQVASLDVYKISTEHLNYNGGISAPYRVTHKSEKQDVVRAVMEANSAYYIELNDESGKSDLDARSTSAELLKKEYYYDVRAYGMPYAETHAQSLVTHISMADNDIGKTAISLKLQTADSLTLAYEKWGDFAGTAEGMLGFRIDFRGADGRYDGSVLYSFGGKNEEFDVPFGTGSAALERIDLANERKGSVTIKLADKAPRDWTGEIALTFMMKDAGAGTTVKYQII